MKRIDSNQGLIVRALRDAGADVQSLADIGKGCPDLLVWHPRTGYAIAEVKDGTKPPSKRKLTPDEQKFHEKWRGPIHILESVDDAMKMIGVNQIV